MLELASNSIKGEDDAFASRFYPLTGSAHVVGFLKYPLRDSKGIFYDTEYAGREGAELIYNTKLSGRNGTRLIETDVSGKVISESMLDRPEDGGAVVLSVDGRVNEILYQGIASLAETSGFVGGSGVIMDVRTGEILALTSYPEYNPNTVTRGTDRRAIENYLSSSSKPFLNRAIGGLYAPGSIIKPIIALAALEEGIISPNKRIYSSGSISIPNPYDPENPSVFRDWRAHGWTDMREAIAVSSDTYFYSIGGGYGDQKGLGITKIDEYLELFGLKDRTGIAIPGEVLGIIPTPEWKREKFDGDIWRLGDTYITSIGQFGTQITPLVAVRFTSAIANESTLLTPTILSLAQASRSDIPTHKSIKKNFSSSSFKIVKEGMREAVTNGTATILNVPYVAVAAKTGTAEIGAAKRYVHSWIIGFFPFEEPRYAFAVVMERGPSTNTMGAGHTIRRVLDWMNENAPDYLR